jgi:hypothetical protein
MKVGDVIWYRSLSWEGSAYNQVEIVRETPRSWVVMNVKDAATSWMRSSDKHATKLPKSGEGWSVGSDLAAALQRWVATNRYKISQQVDRLYDGEKLLAIAQIVGYDILPTLGEQNEVK